MTDNLASLADRYAAAQQIAEITKKELELIRTAILATGVEVLVGDRVRVKVCLSEREQFDSKAAKALLSAEQASACTKKSLVTTLRVAPVV